MGIYDRDYSHDDYQGAGRPRMRISFGPLPPMVMRLIVANVVIFIAEFMLWPHPSATNLYGMNPVEVWFSAVPFDALPGAFLQVWRIFSYQFLHANFGHVFFNMISLFFLGRILENHWGGKKFLIFYLSCGAAGGIAYPLLVSMNVVAPGFLVGASGSVFGVIAAVAILFPKLRFYIFGVFPVYAYILAIILVVWGLLSMYSGNNAGGQAAHLAGMAAGAIYVLWKPMQQRKRLKTQKGAWERKMQSEHQFQADVDRILDKLHKQGIASLTKKEKQILKEATNREQKGPFSN